MPFAILACRRTSAKISSARPILSASTELLLTRSFTKLRHTRIGICTRHTHGSKRSAQPCAKVVVSLGTPDLFWIGVGMPAGYNAVRTRVSRRIRTGALGSISAGRMCGCQKARYHRRRSSPRRRTHTSPLPSTNNCFHFHQMSDYIVRHLPIYTEA